MSGWLLFLIIFGASLLSGVLSVLRWEYMMLHECHGTIVMYEDQVYLSLTKEDIYALEHKRFATLRLQREKFKGFSET